MGVIVPSQPLVGQIGVAGSGNQPLVGQISGISAATEQPSHSWTVNSILSGSTVQRPATTQYDTQYDKKGCIPHDMEYSPKRTLQRQLPLVALPVLACCTMAARKSRLVAVFLRRGTSV
ncbi:hypothetical protein G1C97_1967 [Bifidobacterium sp. DSM 109959]|uniref:Uncharacterized protein n=1 Tax=Bifidobacterium olomucense TaxID=2675324 RepID=A0A7Y0EZ13_9BIFI|nr:hypothetical protein [Bifidobacterium sp. DSM 109959]